MSDHTREMRLVTVCVGMLLMGGASTALLAQATAATVPVPGTRDYYEQKIKGSHAFCEGELIPATDSGATGASRPLVLGMTRPSRAYWLDGRILQVLSNDLVVVGQTVTNASGVVTCPRSGLVALTRAWPVKVGEPFRLLTIQEGSYQYKTALTNGTLRAYREVAEPTYEEYRKVFERDSQTVAPEPIVSITRNGANRLGAPGFARLSSPLSPSQVRLLPPGLRRLSNLAAPLYTTTNYVVTLAQHNNTNGEVTVTNEVNGLPVVAIGPGAFRNCGQITAVAFPDSLTSIGPEAFKNCASLTRITIPAGVTRIDESAFWECPALESILVSVLNPVYSSSADGVLFNAEKTRLIRYPQGKKDGYTIPSRVTHIGGGAFRDCVNLSGVTIQNGVAAIEGGAFWNCSSLTSVKIPASVTYIDAWAFSGCSRLEAIPVDDTNPVFCNGVGGVVLNREKTKIIRYPSGKKGDYAIPTDIKQIGGGAFEGSMGLSGVTIPAGITVVEGGTFKNCSNLTSAVLPSTVTRLRGEAFSHCSNLTALALPEMLVELGGFAFWDCTNLTRIAIPGSVTRIEGSTFQGCRRLEEVTIRSGVASIDSHAFAWCGLTTITIPASVTNIASCAFRGCTALSAIHFEGDAPCGAADTSIFCDGTANVTVYHRPDAKGWGETFGGRPTAVWKP